MRKVLLLLCVGMALAGPLEAQRRRQIDFKGRVILGNGQTQADIVVQILGMNGEPIAAKFTDVKGTFEFPNLAMRRGWVYLVVEEEGYKPVRRQLFDYDVRKMMLVFLEPEAGAGNGGSNSAVDLRQLVEPPEEAREEYDKALEESEKGNHQRAIERLEKVLELAPDFYAARIKLGVEYLALGQYRDAEAAYEKAMQSNPNVALGPLNMAVLHYQEGESQSGAGQDEGALRSFESARDFLEDAIALDPVSARAQFYLGTTLYKMGGYAEAELLLQRALELKQGYPDARLTLINVYARQTRYEAALQQAVAFLEENPDASQGPAIERVKSQIEAALGR